jgi:hypothetical protein
LGVQGSDCDLCIRIKTKHTHTHTHTHTQTHTHTYTHTLERKMSSDNMKPAFLLVHWFCSRCFWVFSSGTVFMEIVSHLRVNLNIGKHTINFESCLLNKTVKNLRILSTLKKNDVTKIKLFFIFTLYN